MKIFVGYKKYHVEKRCTQYVFIVNIKKKKLAPVCDRSRVAVADFGIATATPFRLLLREVICCTVQLKSFIKTKIVCRFSF